MSFVGGKLKLKGGEPLKASGAVKKKKKKAPSSELVRHGSDAADPEAEGAPKKTTEGYVLKEDPAADRRTEAEKRREEKVRKMEEERLKKLAAKGYRERVKEFNEHLASLSEHHDIPKVGPG